ncbi:hypothetical protein [Streptomyces sp. NPDC002763]|uniref:hypothetical protein n=1 Tax=Streptomyces sp. NPDC002763 TaxID=3154427 RepID=UPI0033210910
MYALIVPASTPFVLLATVLGLSWWEDRILPSAEPAEPEPAEASGEAPLPPAPLTELLGVDTPLTREVARR